MVDRKAGCFVLAFLVASPVLAEPPNDISPTMFVLGDKYVQVELELTPKQCKKLGDFWNKQAGQSARLANLQSEQRFKKKKELTESVDRALFDILSGDQRQRLKEITFQLLGAKAYADPEVIRELEIGQEQQLQIAVLEDVARGELMQWFQDLVNIGKTPSIDARRKKLRELEKVAEAKTFKLLTDIQKAKWKELIGRPYGSLPETSASLTRQMPPN